MTVATTCTVADAVLDALRTLAAADGLWVEAGDEAIALAAGVPVIDVPEALGQLEGASSIGRIDDRDGLAGRVVYLSDHPRAAELHAMAYLTRRGLPIQPLDEPEPEPEPPTRPADWPRPYRRRNVPDLVPLFPPVGFAPGWRCGHSTVPIPPGDPVICMHCHASGWDDEIEAEARHDDAQRVEVSRAMPRRGDWSADAVLAPGLGSRPGKVKSKKAKKARRKAARSA